MDHPLDDLINGIQLLFSGSGLQPRGQVFFAAILVLIVVSALAIVRGTCRGAASLLHGKKPRDGAD